MERKWSFGGGYAVSFAMCLFVSSNAAGGVYKCVDKLGNTGYQTKPCDDLDKSTQVEIEKFEKPATVTTQESEVSDSSSGQEARNETAENKEKQRVAACYKLRRRYSNDLRQAKSTDAARKRAEERYKKKMVEQDRKMLNTYKKDKKQYKKQLKKRRNTDSIYRRGAQTPYAVDLVKNQYKRDKKKLSCSI